jgi:hypothetical protein
VGFLIGFREKGRPLVMNSHQQYNQADLPTN